MGPRLFPPGGSPRGVIYILHFIFYLYLFYHQSSIITHQSSVINHQSSIISYQINDPSSVINYPSSILCRHFVLNFLPTLCDQFFLDMHATSGQHAGNLRTSSKTLGKDWKGSGSLGKPLGTVGKCWKPSF